jgi:HEAT repeat protein
VATAAGDALLAVWRFRRPANVPAIGRWLSSADAGARWRAAYALSRRPDPRGTELLFARVNDPEPLVRSFAVRALSNALADSSSVTAARALPAVLAATRDADHAVSVNAVRTLGTYAAPQSISRLLDLLNGPDAYLAITAAESLDRLGSRAPASADALRRIALDRTKPIALRTTALASLGDVDAAMADGVADVLYREAGWRPRAAAARIFALAAGRPGYETSPGRAKLEAAARDADGRVAAAALEAAVAAAGDSMVRIRPLLLLTVLQAPDFYARVNALGGLGQLADPSTAPALMDAYARAQSDSMDDAALAAIDALGAVGKKDPEAVRFFFRRFRRPRDYLVREHAVAAFGDAATAAWGPALPILTGRGMDFYRTLARRQWTNPRPRARIVTSRGSIDLELFADDAPITVDNFLTLARRRFFDGQEWPRVVANFVIQGGDPRGDTNGGPGTRFAMRSTGTRTCTAPWGWRSRGPTPAGASGSSPTPPRRTWTAPTPCSAA